MIDCYEREQANLTPRCFPHSLNARRKRISWRSANPRQAPSLLTLRRSYRRCTNRLQSGSYTAGPRWPNFSSSGSFGAASTMGPSLITSTAIQVVYDFALPQRRHEGRQPQKSSPSGNVVSVLFLPWGKPNLSDNLLVCFGALALSQAIGALADTGILIYGDGYRRRSEDWRKLGRCIRNLLPRDAAEYVRNAVQAGTLFVV